jgi:mitotic spindle assembly checkpoint protein MAD2
MHAFLFILLLRIGIYMPETFKRESKYGLTVLTTTDAGLLSYLANIQKQMRQWLLDGSLQRLVVVVQGVESMETLERWQFNVSVDNSTKNVLQPTTVASPNVTTNETTSNEKKTKTVKEVHNEIQAIIRQITASVTFLPLLDEPCTFDLLVYTDKTANVPEKWADSDPCYIMNSAEVKLRSFTTTVHQVDAMVCYKEADEWEL